MLIVMIMGENNFKNKELSKGIGDMGLGLRG
jgi:hypothetical protein